MAAAAAAAASAAANAASEVALGQMRRVAPVVPAVRTTSIG